MCRCGCVCVGAGVCACGYVRVQLCLLARVFASPATDCITTHFQRNMNPLQQAATKRRGITSCSSAVRCRTMANGNTVQHRATHCSTPRHVTVVQRHGTSPTCADLVRPADSVRRVGKVEAAVDRRPTNPDRRLRAGCNVARWVAAAALHDGTVVCCVATCCTGFGHRRDTCDTALHLRTVRRRQLPDQLPKLGVAEVLQTRSVRHFHAARSRSRGSRSPRLRAGSRRRHTMPLYSEPVSML